MQTTTTRWLCMLSLFALGGALLPGVQADDEAQPAGAATSPLKTADDKQAKALAAEIKKIGKKKNAAVVIPVLEKIDALEHKVFDKVLFRLLKHKSSLVALRVADMWEWRVRDKKVAARLWKASWGEKGNARRYAVKAKTLKAFARGGIPLSPPQFKEVDRAWRWIVGNPDPRFAPALTGIAVYAGLAQDKRLFRKLAEELDEPGATSVSAPSNPPASWWKNRWDLWKEAKPAVVEALKALSGREFDKTAEAKAWCKKQARKSGFDW